MSMTSDDPTERLTALEARVRDAWGTYRENLTDLDGIAYDEAEKAEWGHLQEELHEIASERSAVEDGLRPSSRAA